jgi:hypothetical protein
VCVVTALSHYRDTSTAPAPATWSELISRSGIAFEPARIVT